MSLEEVKKKEYVEAIILAVYMVTWEFMDYRLSGYDPMSLPPGAYRLAEFIDEIYSDKVSHAEIKQFIKDILGGILYPRFLRFYKEKFKWLDESI
ncbi:hypothetical protein ThvES_00021110 [Thiovulum sp. ES]|nr:hypothetical protein ThvES_00021110 [Thiovulum sp. ES]